MGNRDFSVEIIATCRIVFDDTEECNAIIENYRKYIADEDLEGIACNIASHIARYGYDSEIEGIGLVRINGEEQHNAESYCPVSVYDADFDFNGLFDFM